MSLTFDPHDPKNAPVKTSIDDKAGDVLMTNPTACLELEKYWAALPRRRGVPMRNDVDPSDMAGMLEDSFILERVAPGVARIRVAGRNVTKLFGLEPRGLPLTAVFLPNARAGMADHLETAFKTPAIVELAVTSPRAIGQPKLDGKILLLPLRDMRGSVTRIMGLLVMSGRRGIGGRRFTLSEDTAPRIEPVVSLKSVPTPPNAPPRARRGLRDRQKAGDIPALRLVVSNDM